MRSVKHALPCFSLYAARISLELFDDAGPQDSEIFRRTLCPGDKKGRGGLGLNMPIVIFLTARGYFWEAYFLQTKGGAHIKNILTGKISSIDALLGVCAIAGLVRKSYREFVGGGVLSCVLYGIMCMGVASVIARAVVHVIVIVSRYRYRFALSFTVSLSLPLSLSSTLSPTLSLYLSSALPLSLSFSFVLSFLSYRYRLCYRYRFRCRYRYRYRCRCRSHYRSAARCEWVPP